jgi:hypothetical protein
MFLCRLKEEIRRLKAGQVDISIWACVCFCQASKPANVDVACWGNTSQNFISTKWGPAVVQPPVWASGLLLTVVLLVLAFLSMPQMMNGWVLYHFVDQNTNTWHVMYALTAAFSLWEQYIDYHCVDIPYQQQDVIDFWTRLLANGKMYPALTPDKLSMFAIQMLIGAGPTVLGACLDNSFAMKDPADCTPVAGDSVFLNTVAMGLGLPSWIFGLVLNDEFYEIYNAWADVPEDPWEPILTPRGVANDYTNADLVKSFEDAFDAHGHVQCWVDLYYVLEVQTNALIEENLENHRQLMNDDPLSGRQCSRMLLMWYWEVFAYTQDLFGMSLTSISICVFGVTWVLLRSVKAAIVGTTMDVVVVLELWGLVANWAEFNVFTYAFLLLAFGIAVEFTAHQIAYFELAKGDALQRLRIAMRATIPPVILGGWSTMLSIVPVWFGPQMAGYIYCSSILTSLQFIGFLNGIWVLPSLLAMVAFILGICGMGMQRVSSKRNSKGSQPAAAETPAAGEQKSEDQGAKANTDVVEYAVDLDDAPVSPVRKFVARGHFNQV